MLSSFLPDSGLVKSWGPPLLVGFAGGVLASQWLSKKRHSSKESEQSEAEMYPLHWNPRKERRGLGNHIRSLNHVALIVSDVGRSLAFYVEILGLQQIQRPNFDRHGAWLTLGNTELHLIKGIPVVSTGKDLIVSHMALDTDRPDLVLQKLLEMKVPFRQNISVPDPDKARNNLVESFDDSDGKVTQYFIRDPDGYYFELCNCEILTKFCLEKEAAETSQSKSGMNTYTEGCAPETALRCPIGFKISCIITQRVHRARANLRAGYMACLADAMKGIVKADEADEKLLEALLNRQRTYCDVTQGFRKQDLENALKLAGNHCPTAILILRSKRADERVMLPPVYLMNDGGDEDFEGNKVKQHLHKTKRSKTHLRKLGSPSMYAGKPFVDNEHKAFDVETSTPINRVESDLFGT